MAFFIAILFGVATAGSFYLGKQYGQAIASDGRKKLNQAQIMELERYEINLKYKILGYNLHHDEKPRRRIERERMGQEP